MKSSIFRISTAGAVICALSAILPAASAMAQDGVRLEGLALDKLDDNRFFTRLGGTVRNALTYDGLNAGEAYTVTGQLFNKTTGQMIGEPVAVTFTPESTSGAIDVEMAVPQNRTPFNIDYVVITDLYLGDVAGGTPVAMLEDKNDSTQTIQLHAIQGISVTAMAADGTQALPGTGGTITARVDYVNMVEGYAYTIWGELLTPSGQAIGVFSSVAEYRPEGKAGTLTLDFEVPEGYEGISLVPSSGLYHKSRVEITENGYLNRIPGSANPVMIASDPDLNDAAASVAIGAPFIIE